MDSLGQNVIGLSEPFWVIRFKIVIYKQTYVLRILLHPKIAKNQRPDNILRWFLYHSGWNNPAQITSNLEFPENLKFNNKTFRKFRKNAKLFGVMSG